jgi:CheY-like chemotaxis protein
VFEKAGYVAYAAGDHRQAVAFATRLLPDVVVLAVETPDTLDILMRLSAGPTTRNIPLIVLTPSELTTSVRDTRNASGIILVADSLDLDVLASVADALIEAGPRARRTLKRRLLDIQELARFYPPDRSVQAHLQQFIDRLQVAMFAGGLNTPEDRRTFLVVQPMREHRPQRPLPPARGSRCGLRSSSTSSPALHVAALAMPSRRR